MDGVLKVLVTAACCVVIAGGGYFAWAEYQRSVELTAAKEHAYNEQLEKARDELLKLQQPCKKALNDLRTYDVFEKPNVEWSAEHLTARVRDCLAKGLLTADDGEKVKHRLHPGAS